MSDLVTAFLYNPLEQAIVLVQKLNRPGRPFALPGGKTEKGESAKKAAIRETSEEVGEKAAEAVKNAKFLLISRRSYKQIIFFGEYSGPLKKRGFEERNKSGVITEKLGSPVWINYKDIEEGYANGSKIYNSHLNVIHKIASHLAKEDIDFAYMTQKMKRFSFER